MAGRVRAALRTITSAPWRRAPRLLWRRPGVLATVAAACAVMAASVAAVPLFLSSAGTASVDLQAAERCPTDTGATYRRSLPPSQVRAEEDDPFRAVTDALGPPNRWTRLERVLLFGADASSPLPIWLVERDGALEHTEILESVDEPGMWITDRAAAELGLAAGDMANLGDAQVPVAGIYRDLAGTSVDDYWCSLADALLLEVRGADLVLPPPMVLVDRPTFADLMEALDAPVAEAAWEAPLRPGLTVHDTEDLVARLACATPTSPVLTWCDDGRRPPVGSRRLPDRTVRQIFAVDDADFVTRFLDSHLPFVTQRSTAIQTAVGGGVWPMAGFAALAGAGLVAAAASLWFDRRRREVRLLTVRGVSPAALGLKAVLELALALAAGVVLGVGAAYVLVVWLGPSAHLEGAAVVQAALGAAAALVGAAVVVAAVVAWRARALHPGRPRRLPLGALPWELLLGWATVVSYQRLGDWGIPVGRGANVTRVDVLGLLFPVLFLVTAVAVLSRVLSLGLRPLRAISRSWPTALYLGVRRVARYRVAVLGLVAASALAAGVLGYAASMNRSLDATLGAKASTFVGSDLAVRVPPDAEVPDQLADQATEVTLHWDAWIDAGERQKAAVIAIDPATFETAAYWDDTFADAPLRELVARLDGPGRDGTVPAVVVGRGAVTGRAEVGIVSGGTKRFEVTALPDVRTFPGMRRPKITVFVAARSLEGLDLGPGRTELWVEGDRDRSLDALRSAGFGFSEERRAAEIADGASFVTVAWTFGFMLSLGLSAGLLVLGGVATYLDARGRDRLLGYAFMQRMGLRRGPHRRALLVELTASVVVGCWVGLGIALVAAWLAHSRIDPVPTYRPEPLLRPATSIVLGLALLALVLSVVGAVLAQRRADRDDAVEVLRAGV